MTMPHFKPAKPDDATSARIINTMETIMQMLQVSRVSPSDSLNALVLCVGMHINATDYKKEEFLARVMAQLDLMIQPGDMGDEGDNAPPTAGVH